MQSFLRQSGFRHSMRMVMVAAISATMLVPPAAAETLLVHAHDEHGTHIHVFHSMPEEDLHSLHDRQHHDGDADHIVLADDQPHVTAAHECQGILIRLPSQQSDRPQARVASIGEAGPSPPMASLTATTGISPPRLLQTLATCQHGTVL